MFELPRLFGTDGVRGIANVQLDPITAFLVGKAAACTLAAGTDGLVVGRDPRHSGDLLLAAVTAGIMSAGANVLDLGVVTTPVVAFAARHLQAAGGIMISASHNPFEYNGIKVFAGDGYKLSDEREDHLESLVRRGNGALPSPDRAGIGRRCPVEDAVEPYIRQLAGTSGGSLRGLRVVVDCAHGAATGIAPRVFASLGAAVTAMGSDPDGTNINVDSGSTSPQALARMVVEGGADLGVALDGDGDRVIAVDENGSLVDGDAILAILGEELAGQGKLAGGVVGTVMSNLGLELALARVGLELVRAPVGDRYVLDAMRQHGFRLGGEQSGHVILLDHATTGDGILTAVQLGAVMMKRRERLSQLASVFQRVPQVLVNVKVADRTGVEENETIRAAVEEATRLLGGHGRVLVRPSGTEPLVRVMVEAIDAGSAHSIADRLAQVVKAELAG
jgi:phosphoglucosamine mutase